MIGKNNIKILNKNKGEHVVKYSIKKLNFGAASVIVAAGILFSISGGEALASDTETPKITNENISPLSTEVKKEVSNEITSENLNAAKKDSDKPTSKVSNSNTKSTDSLNTNKENKKEDLKKLPTTVKDEPKSEENSTTDKIEQLKKEENNNSDKNIVYKRILVKFEKENRDNILEQFSKIKNLKIKFNYDFLFYGASLDVPNDKVEQLYAIKGLTTIQESKKLREHMFNAKGLTDVIKARENNKNYGELDGRGTVVAVIDSGIDINHPAMRLDENNADVMAKRKIKNVSDKGNFTNKVPYGFNYVNGNYELKDGVSAPHGMHIAGIIAGNDKDPNGFKGIAPNAQLLAYRVFTSEENKSDEPRYIADDVMFHAMEDAIKRGADIISLSVGLPGTGLPNDIWYDVAQKAKNAGVVVVAAIGNYGMSNSTTTGENIVDKSYKTEDSSATVSIAANADVIGVGSIRNGSLYLPSVTIGEKKYHYSDILADNEEVITKSGALNTDQNLEFYYFKKGLPDDIEDNEDFENIKGKVAIVDRGDESIYDKMLRFLDAGAKGVIMINDSVAYSRGNYKTHPALGYSMKYPKKYNGWAISLSRDEGEDLLSQIAKSKNLKINYSLKPESFKAGNSGVSGFSAWGSTHDLEIKPDLVAPGEDIYSTANDDKFAIKSGTSMSSPHVAGLSALLQGKVKQLLQDESNKKLLKNLGIIELNKILLMNTAKPLIDTELVGITKEELEYSPRRQGAGLANLDQALRTDVIATYNDKASIALKEFNGKHTITITLRNLSDKRRTFKINKSAVLGERIMDLNRKDEGKDVVMKSVFSKVMEGGSLTGDYEINLSPKGMAEIDLVLEPGVAKDEFVEGFIYLKSMIAKQPDLVLPYMGFTGNWNKDKIFDAPKWDKDSKTNLSSLLAHKYLSHEKNDYIDMGIVKEGDTPNPDNFAISTFGTKRAIPKLIFLRSAVDFEAAIVDSMEENAKVITVLKSSHYPMKFIASEYFENNGGPARMTAPDEKLAWEGEFYNAEKDQTEIVKDGQYYYRFRARLTKDSPYQTFYIPIKVDNKAPEVDLNFNDTTKELVVTATDNNKIKNVAVSEGYNKLTPTKIEGNTYYFKLHENTDKKRISVAVQDFAGNKTTKDLEDSDAKFEKETLNKEVGIFHKNSTINKLAHSVDDEDIDDDDFDENWEENSNEFSRKDVEINNGLILTEDNIGNFDKNSDIRVIDGEVQHNINLNLRPNQYATITNTNLLYNKKEKTEDGQEPYSVTKYENSEDSTEWINNWVPLYSGENTLDIKVFTKDENGKEHVVYRQTALLVVDLEKPKLELLNEHDDIEYNDNENSDYTGIIKSHNGKVQLSGFVEDNMDSWRLKINDNEVDSYELLGFYGENRRKFDYILDVTGINYVKISAEDTIGNIKEYKFKIEKSDTREITENKTDNSKPKETTNFTEDKTLNATLKEFPTTVENLKLEDLLLLPKGVSAVLKTYSLQDEKLQQIVVKLFKDDKYNLVTYEVPKEIEPKKDSEKDPKQEPKKEEPKQNPKENPKKEEPKQEPKENPKDDSKKEQPKQKDNSTQREIPKINNSIIENTKNNKYSRRNITNDNTLPKTGQTTNNIALGILLSVAGLTLFRKKKSIKEIIKK